jgi:hypothetical protein
MPGRKPSLLFWICVGAGLAQFAVLCLAVPDLQNDWLQGAGLALSSGIAASAVWWAFFSRYAESEGRRFLEFQLAAQRALLDRELDDHRALLVSELDETARRWRDSSLARDIYPAAEGFDLRFNRDLTKDLARSSKYLFCGPSGIYVPARILLRETTAPTCRLDDVRLWIIDPNSDLAMEQAIRGRRGKATNRGKPDDQIRTEILDNLFMTLIALWEVRDKVRGSIGVWHESTAVIKRIELFDHAVYDSNVEGPGPEDFPTTGCWSSGQTAYIRVSEQLERQDHVTASVTIASNTPQRVFDEHLDKLGFDHDRIDELWARYRSRYLARMELGIPRAVNLRDVEPTRELEEVARGHRPE